MTIYFVDEDYARFGPWLVELSLRGLRPEAIGDADSAFLTLIDSDDVELVIIDVMLSARPRDSRFSPERTDDYLQTGLCLLEDLANHGGPAFPLRSILLTNAVSGDILRAAESVSGRLAVPLWQKLQILSPFDFGERVTRRLGEIELAPRSGQSVR